MRSEVSHILLPPDLAWSREAPPESFQPDASQFSLGVFGKKILTLKS